MAVVILRSRLENNFILFKFSREAREFIHYRFVSLLNFWTVINKFIPLARRTLSNTARPSHEVALQRYAHEFTHRMSFMAASNCSVNGIIS